MYLPYNNILIVLYFSLCHSEHKAVSVIIDVVIARDMTALAVLQQQRFVYLLNIACTRQTTVAQISTRFSYDFVLNYICISILFH